jgi:poly-gamma-glutamate capsule biosynthesis protein CapA/YwtB (metallophosphatase superfamily)
MKITIITLSVLYFLIFNSPDSLKVQEHNSEIKNGTRDSCVTISISVVGDLMCHSPQYDYARVSSDSFDFDPVFKDVTSILSSSDFTFGNLETITAGKEYGGYSGYPRFNTPKSYISALARAGFDLLVTANNHSLDRGEIGVIRTIEEIKKNHLSYVGSFSSEKDRDSIRIYNINGVKLSVLAYSYGTNGNIIPKGKSYLVNLINFNLIANDISKARAEGAELVLVHYHFGKEYKREPVQFQTDVVNNTILLGADLIIGGHPHVLEPAKFFKTQNAKLDTGFVAYSMGNFISNQRKRYTDAGMILTLKIYKNFISNKIQIKEVNFIPTWVYKGIIANKNEYLILPSTTKIDSNSFLSRTDSVKMVQAFSDTRYIIKKYSNSSRLKEFEK